MSEQRIKMSEVQFTALINTQTKLNDAQRDAGAAQEDLNKVIALVLDSHGLPQNSKINIDPQTRELVYDAPDSPIVSTDLPTLE